MDYHTFAKRAKPNVCTCCGISAENLQNPFVFKNFGGISFEHIGGYFVPLCERCSARISGLGRFITSGFYKQEVEPPYTANRIVSRYLDKCIEEGFFIRMGITAQTKIMSKIDSFMKKHARKKAPTVKEYIKELETAIAAENKRNEYVRIEMSPAYKEEFPFPMFEGFQPQNSKTHTAVDLAIYPSIPEKNTQCIIQTKFVCE